MTNVDGKVLFNLIETVAVTASLKYYWREADQSFVRGYMDSAFVSILDSLPPEICARILADYSKRLLKANQERRAGSTA